MILRAARAKDAPAVTGWFRTRAEVVRWAGPDVPEPLTADWLAGEFALADRDYLVLADEDDHTPYGVAGVRWFPAQGRAHLIAVGLDPQVRGYGVSRLLLKGAEAVARGGGAERVTLSVFSDNEPARRAYEAAGYFTCGLDERVVRMLKPLGAAAAQNR
jgi:ribosomal protein S18 acetylase RimI-like enzyme